MPVKHNNKGFVILYAVVITTVVLVMGISLMNIVTKQLVISSIARGAKLSYFAAMSGKECAQYWKAIGYFGTVSFDGESGFKNWTINPPDESELQAVVCPEADGDIEYLGTDSGDGALSYSYQLDFPEEKLCSRFKVTLRNSACPSQQVFIESEGYNASCNELTTNNPRRVRSIYSDLPVKQEYAPDTSSIEDCR